MLMSIEVVLVTGFQLTSLESVGAITVSGRP